LGARNIRIVEATGSNPVYSILKALCLLALWHVGNQKVIKKVIRHMFDYSVH
jgi:hypothetical protein